MHRVVAALTPNKRAFRFSDLRQTASRWTWRCTRRQRRGSARRRCTPPVPVRTASPPWSVECRRRGTEKKLRLKTKLSFSTKVKRNQSKFAFHRVKKVSNAENVAFYCFRKKGFTACRLLGYIAYRMKAIAGATNQFGVTSKRRINRAHICIKKKHKKMGWNL